MEVFGAITAAITVLQQIIRVYEQAGQNANDGVTLSNDIIDFLTHIEDHLRQQPLSITDSLRNDLTEFENSLREILRRHQRLMGHNVNGLWARSTAKLKAFSNASDIQHQLVELHRNIQTCCQKLQISCAVRTDVGVAVITEHMTALRQDTNGLIAEMHQSQVRNGHGILSHLLGIRF
ncbi:hypothetical protein FRC03_000391 [Tulasnella sp. 419]|nr:hypothetical protein FRC03_000391 [Tulasnella sp. 419]